MPLRRGELVFPSAGCAGVVVLVLATALPGRVPARLPAALTGMAVVVLAWLGLGWSHLSVPRLYWKLDRRRLVPAVTGGASTVQW